MSDELLLAALQCNSQPFTTSSTVWTTKWTGLTDILSPSHADDTSKSFYIIYAASNDHGIAVAGR